MARHYVYRLDHDTGFAPHVGHRMCTVCGCKIGTIEKWAQPESWVIGIGGNGTGKPDALIYTMRVESTPRYADFLRRYPRESAYLRMYMIDPVAPVLLSTHFYYFGDNAVQIPRSLKRIIIRRQGCKRVDDDDVALLETFLAQRYYVGVHGRPNNKRNDTQSSHPCTRKC